MNRDSTINIAKMLTVVCLLLFAGLYPFSVRSALYLGMHLSYCIWFLLNQLYINKWVNNERNSSIEQKDNILKVTIILLLVGIFYAFPGWLAFNNIEPVTSFISGFSIALFFFGSVIVTTIDSQRNNRSSEKSNAFSDHNVKVSANLRYLGELLRYSSFALLSGSPWAWFVVLTVALFEHPFGILRWAKESLFHKYN